MLLIRQNEIDSVYQIKKKKYWYERVKKNWQMNKNCRAVKHHTKYIEKNVFLIVDGPETLSWLPLIVTNLVVPFIDGLGTT